MPRENTHNRVYNLISRIAPRTFFLKTDKRFIGVMKRSSMVDRVYSYDFDRLASDGGVACTYDALVRRVSTTTLEGMVRHVYDNNWQCIADVDEQGNVVASYTWGEGAEISSARAIDFPISVMI